MSERPAFAVDSTLGVMTHEHVQLTLEGDSVQSRHCSVSG